MSISNYFFALIMLSAGGLAAVTPWSRQAAQPAAQTQAETVTITGCLQAGEPEGTFVLTADDKQAYQVQASEDLTVGSHVNHRVELSGTVEKTETSLVLKAASLNMLASSCDR